MKKLSKQNRKKLLKLILLVLAAYAALVAAVLFIADGRHVRFYLVDGPEIQTAYGKPFVDPGRYAVATGRLSGEEERELPVETVGEVDVNTLGTYVLTYTTRYHLLSYTTTRTVQVLDMTPPAITLEQTEGYEPNWFTGYKEEGFTAVDDYDGDLTAKVECFYYDDRAEYIVCDSSGNETKAVRPLQYTLGRPEIRLNGPESLELPAQIYYEDPGFRAEDDRGNDMTEYVQVEGEVIPYQPGSYELTYSISNAQGETVSAKRQIEVVPVGKPETVYPEGRVIYLTFDDGPGPYTARLLNVLDRYHAKATFFVTCLDPQYEDMVGRAYREGHSIGVHSATHNYGQIYASEDAFLADFSEAEEMVYRQTGSYTKLFRFPGGSSNTVSSFNPGIMHRLVRIMTDMGYSYFDWDVTSGDAGETTRTTQVVDNVIGGCLEQRVSVVLQHDIKDFSVAAVEKILSWGARNGYTFMALDETSPQAHHGIAN